MKLNKWITKLICALLVFTVALLPHISVIAYATDTISFTYSDEEITVEVDVSGNTVFIDDSDVTYEAEDIALYAYALEDSDPRFETLEIPAESELKLFDIGFVTKEDDIPVKAVNAHASVRYSLPQKTDVSDITDVTVYRYVGDEQGDTVQEETGNVHTANRDNAVVFNTDELTSYAVVYTVDYEFNGRTFKMAGGSSLLLSELFRQFEFDLDVADVEEVTFSDDTLLRVEQVAGEVVADNDETFDAGDGDWLLTSLGAFHTKEKLVITLKDGTRFTMKVTDAEYSTDLSRFLTEDGMKLIIDGNVITGANDGETITVEDGELYNLIVSFAETPDLQFSNDQPLTFRLPDAFHPPRGFSMSLDINLGRYGKLMNNPVSYDPDTNTLTVQWNEEDTVHFQRLIDASNAKFTLNVRGTIDADAVRFMFDQEKGVFIQRYDPHNAKVEKSGEYDPDTQTITYTIDITSDGSCQNITLNDDMGTALVYQGDCTFDSANSINNANTTPVITNTGGTFHVDIPAMNNGDMLRFTYSCQVDIENIAVSGNATFEETGNTAVIAGDSIPDDNISEYAQNEIYFSNIVKENTGVGGTYTIGETPYRDIGWRIDTNQHPLISFAGTQIADTIDPRVQDMCSYSGDGITVKCYDMSGTLQATRVLSWADLGYDPMTDNIKSWAYNVPADDPKYEYVVEYKTKVDMSKVQVQTVISNVATSKAGESKAYCVVTPPGTHGLSVSKTHTDFTSDHITWEITVHVDSEYQGDHLTLTEHCNFIDNLGIYKYDGLPGNTIGNKLFKEFLEKVEVVGLTDDETYVVKYNNRNYNANDDQLVEDNFIHNTGNANNNDRNRLVIDFFKDKNRTQKGLDYGADGDSGRNLIIRLTTSFDPDWPQAAKRYMDANGTNKNQWMYDHHNWVDVNGALAVDKATKLPIILYKSPNATQNDKDGGYKSHNVVDPETGVIYQTFRFRILVQNINSDAPIVIDDYFDTDLFELFIPDESPLMQSNGMLMSQRNWESTKRPTKNKNDFDTVFGGADSRSTYLSSSNFVGQRTWYRNVSDDSYVREATDYGARFTINDIPKKENGDYYAYYGVEYWLIPKNEDAIAVIEQQIHDGIGTFGTTARGQYKKYDNAATCRGEEASCQYDLYLDNKLLPLLKTSQIDDDNYVAHYTIEINKRKQEMNEGLPIVLEDTYSDSLAIDFRSIEIETDPAYNHALVSYDFSGRVGTFRVPDSTYVKISYDATILKQPAQDTVISNTVTALGYTEGTSDTISTDHDASGEAENPGLYLYKYGAGHMEKGLNGAQFQLYEYDANGENPTPMYYPAGTPKAGQPIIFETQNVDGKPGFIDVSLSQSQDGMTLQTHKKYGLQEVTPPTTLAPNGEIIEYKPISFQYTFTLVENDEHPNYNAPNYEYMIGDTMTVRNTPKAIGVKISKSLEGSVANELTATDKSKLKFTILRKNDQGEYENILREVEVGGQTLVEINPNFVDIPYDDFVNGNFTLSGLTPDSGSEAGDYMVVETGNDDILAAHPSWNYNTTFRWDDGTVTDTYMTDADNPCGAGHPCSYISITADDVDSGIDKEVYISNNYSKQVINLRAEKKWKNPNGAAIVWPGSTQVILDLYTVDAGGNLSTDPVRTVTLDGVADTNTGIDCEDVGGMAYFKELPKLDENGDELTYVVKERSGLTGYDTTYVGGTEYGTFTDRRATVTNQQRTTSVTVTKSWQNNGGNTTPPAGAAVTVELYAYPQNGSEDDATKVNNVSPVTLDGSETPAWTAAFNDLPVVNSSGTLLSYVVKETACTVNGYEPTYVSGSYAHDGENILNHPALTDFSVTKQWEGTQNNDWPNDVESIDFVLHRRTKTGGAVDTSFVKHCHLTKTGATYTGTLPLNWQGEEPTFTYGANGTKYVLNVTDLDKYSQNDEWEYYVTETLDATTAQIYSISYYDKNKGILENDATNGGTVKNTRSVRDLIIGKTVTGNMGNRFKDFRFTVTLTNADNTPYSGTVNYERTDANGISTTGTAVFGETGTYTFTLTHSETLVLEALPSALKYTVSEDDYVLDGYHTSYTVNGGDSVDGRTTAQGNLASSRNVTFTNHREVLLSTGVKNLLVILAFTVLLTGGAYLCFKRAKGARYAADQPE